MHTQAKWMRIVLGISLALIVVLAIGCSPATTGSSTLAAGTTLKVVDDGTDNVRKIIVNGTGQAYGTPDVAYIVLGVSSVDSDAAKAVADNTAAMNAVIEAVKAAAVEEKDIQTVSYNMWVEQVTDKDGIPTGESRLHIDNQVKITLREPKQAGDLISSALRAGANTVSSISFAVLDTTELQKQARDAAVAQAKARAEQLATGFGATLGTVRTVNEYTSSPMVYETAKSAAYGIGGGDASVSVQSGQFVVTVDIQVEYLIE
ncbi:MAG: SIMPL domain-containing protein [Chloroflexi bacterium]|nr:SIMPL domain-containing protein [Chloroflexota bacterium]